MKRGANINENTSRSGSALQAAAAEGALPFVQFLIENGADVNARSGDPRTSLQIAAAKGHEAVVQLLIAKGADVNVKADGNYVEDGSALHIAAFIGYEKVCRLLLDAGAEVNSESGEYGYALHAAVRRPYNLNLVRLLLERDADVNAFGGRYGTALQSAAAYPDNQAIIQLLLDRGANDREGGWLGSAFLAAVGSGSEDNIRILIAHGINTNAEGGKYGDALQASFQEASIRPSIHPSMNERHQHSHRAAPNCLEVFVGHECIGSEAGATGSYCFCNASARPP